MTETRDMQVVEQALALIDKGLGDLQNRELMAAGEVSDLLLDLRLMLMTADGDTTAV